MFQRCEICGSRLRLREWLFSRRSRGQLSYPMRRIDGVRIEEPVEALCAKCQSRAERRRARGEVQQP